MLGRGGKSGRPAGRRGERAGQPAGEKHGVRIRRIEDRRRRRDRGGGKGGLRRRRACRAGAYGRAEEGKGGGGRRLHRHPHAALGFDCVSGAADVCVDGAYARPAAAGLPARHTKRAAVRLSAISADAAGAVRQPQILFRRLSGAGAPRAEYGLARGRRLGGGDAVRRHRHLYDRRGSRARRLGHSRALPHQPVL